ncbi:beta-lactamase family protein [Parvularcula flava]|uniref:Beta-lactamase family protein n=1 Tax=Aquisalinus luteolus TaxID=1566827 RepID=A0A8J3EQI3_9PROT|nr:serine hydrolase domain-containing protein [Aquisalinus luteolus]NHK27286.1 beta-lactamase family protein [Aquisalinus luteolus]GGH94975.1 hypothetical protein GCM10011355_10420 [Aquisalinus luteolus]
MLFARILPILTTFFSLLIAAQASAVELPDDAEVEEFMRQAHVPGLAIAWLTGGEVVDVRYYGVSDIDLGEPVTDNTVFEAASLTKPMLAYMAVSLNDEGRINLDRPLAETWQSPRVTDTEYYPMLTPRLILSHRTGMPNWAGDPRDPETWEAIPFKWPPGEAFGYSGEAYMLLQAYMAAETGETFGGFFDCVLAGDMYGTALDHVPDGAVPAYGHDGKGQKGFRSRTLDVASAPGGAYSALTSAADYARFVSRVCRGEGLGPEAHRAMLKPQGPVEEKSSVYWALGWGVVPDGGKPIYFHWGDNDVFKAFVAFRGDSCDGVVYFANAQGGLKLIGPLAGPVVGDLSPVIDWLGYGAPGDVD